MWKFTDEPCSLIVWVQNSFPFTFNNSIKRFVDNQAASYQQKSLHEMRERLRISVFIFSQPISTFEYLLHTLSVVSSLFERLFKPSAALQIPWRYKKRKILKSSPLSTSKKTQRVWIRCMRKPRMRRMKQQKLIPNIEHLYIRDERKGRLRSEFSLCENH
jgi:hypothetical protein